jgi:hypothetical protein
MKVALIQPSLSPSCELLAIAIVCPAPFLTRKPRPVRGELHLLFAGHGCAL